MELIASKNLLFKRIFLLILLTLAYTAKSEFKRIKIDTLISFQSQHSVKEQSSLGANIDPPSDHKLHANETDKLLSIGEIKTFTSTVNGIHITTSHAQVAIRIYTPNIIRVQISRQNFINNYAAAVVLQANNSPFTVTENQEKIIIKTDSLQITIRKQHTLISFYTRSNELITTEEGTPGILLSDSKVINHRKLFSDEKFIGSIGNNNAAQRSRSPSASFNDNMPPFYMAMQADKTYGVFFDTINQSFFNLNISSDSTSYYFEHDNAQLTYFFLGAQSYRNLLKDYATLTGKIPMPPIWSLGYQQIVSNCTNDEQIRTVAETLRQKNIPADVIYIDADCADSQKPFTWNTSYANILTITQNLQKIGFRTIFNMNPILKTEQGRSLYDEGVQKNYLLKNKNGSLYTLSHTQATYHLPNFSIPEAQQWWIQKASPFLQTGVDGWVLQMPLCTNSNTVYIANQSKPAVKIQEFYEFLTAQACYEALRKNTQKRPFINSSSTYPGIQRYTSNEEPYSQIRPILTTQASIVAAHALQIFTPYDNKIAFQPWTLSEENQQLIRKDIELRYTLLPYIYNTFYQFSQNGMPICRSLALQFPEDNNTYLPEWQNEYLFGDFILVAHPAINTDSATVYFPEGGWFRLSSDEYYETSTPISVPISANNPPVFVKAGAIVTMQKSIQNTAPYADNVLEVHVWNGTEQSVVTYYEDDGISFDYLKGRFYKRNIRFDTERRLLFFDAPTGMYASKFSSIHIVLHGFKNQVKNIKINGKNQSIKVDARNNTTSITLENSSKAIIVGF